MDTKKLLSSLFYFFLVSLLSGNQQVQGDHHHHHNHRHLFDFRPSKLFVFGDSYADTGNIGKSVPDSWKKPYGITFPGKPAGRFSDGRVLTDYLAKFMGIKSPIPYKFRRVGGKRLRNGMNFAHGGSGVFETLPAVPNMTTQIDFFQQLIKEGVYHPLELHRSSVALVVLSGNDYSIYSARNGSDQGWKSLIIHVVNQHTLNLKRIHGLGVRKVAVTLMQPLGCLPKSSAAYFYQKCNETENSYVKFHNHLLRQAVAELNKQTMDYPFVILDLNSAFETVFANKGSRKFENPFKPCCVGISKEYSCGSVDERGMKKYRVCENPGSAFFWDFGHPTQAAWHAVYLALREQF